MLSAPSAFQPGYEATRPPNPELADRYVAHMTIGDPPADKVMEELADLDQRQLHLFIRAMMDEDSAGTDTVPGALREFFDEVEPFPEWYRFLPVEPGCRVFFRYSDLFVLAFSASTIVRGFGTTISLSFMDTGRVLDNVRRRLRQNLRHLVEIMIPGGLDRHGDGWKLSLRIRLIHARVRKLLANSGDWDSATYGMPISASHVALTAAAFSAMLLNDAVRLGARIDDAERASFIHIWRCSAWLMGVPEELLFRDYADAQELLRVGLGCEPAVSPEGIVMAHSFINSIPHIIGMEGERDQRRMVGLLFRLSRRMIGGKLADELRFPRKVSVGVISFVKFQRRLHELRNLLPVFGGRDLIATNLTDLLERSCLDDEEQGFSYRLPEDVRSELAGKW